MAATATMSGPAGMRGYSVQQCGNHITRAFIPQSQPIKLSPWSSSIQHVYHAFLAAGVRNMAATATLSDPFIPLRQQHCRVLHTSNPANEAFTFSFSVFTLSTHVHDGFLVVGGRDGGHSHAVRAISTPCGNNIAGSFVPQILPTRPSLSLSLLLSEYTCSW